MTAAVKFFPFPLFVVLLAGALSSCSTTPKTVRAPGQPERQNDAFWIGDEVSGKPKLVIDLTAQRIRYYKGEQLVGMSPISSGRESHSTVTGTYRISQKSPNHRSSLYGDYVDADGNVVVEDVDVRKDPRPPGTRFLGAKMNYFMRVVGAIGMHEGYLPGYPASHGCIRLPSDMAEKFYHATPHGTQVQIIGDASLAEHEPPPSAAPVMNAQSGGTSNVPYRTVRKSRSRQSSAPTGTTLYL